MLLPAALKQLLGPPRGEPLALPASPTDDQTSIFSSCVHTLINRLDRKRFRNPCTVPCLLKPWSDST